MPAYSLYFFHPRTRGIIRVEEIEAASNEAAIGIVQSYRGDRALELWQGSTRVHSMDASDLAARLIARSASAAKESSPTISPCNVRGD